MSDFEDDVLNSDGDLDYEVCEEDEEALLADDQSRAGKQQQVLDARERIQMRKMSKTEEEWDEEEEDEDNEGRGRFLSERTPNPQAVPSRPREDIPDSLEQVEVPEAEVANRRPQNNFYGRGRGGRRGGRFFGRGNFRGRGRFNGNDGMGRYHDNQQQPLLQTPVNAPTKILINPHFKGPRPLLSTQQEDKFRPPPPHFGHPQMNSHPPPGPPGPKYQQFNQPLLPPPSQPYHDPPVPYVDQPPPYNPPPPQRLPPPEWGPQDPYYDNRPPPHPEYLPPHRPPPHRQPLLQGPPYGGPPPPREQYHEPPPHRPPPLQQSFPPPPPYQQQAAPPYSQPPPPQFQQLPPPVNYGPPPPVQPSYLQGPPPPLGSTAPYYDHLGGPPPNIYSAPPPTHQQHQPLPLMDRTSIFLSERLERRRRSRSRSPLYDRYSRRSRSRSRSYSPPRRHRDDIRRDRPPPRRLSPEPLRRPVRKLSPPPIRRREASPPPLKRNPEETAYMRAIEKQKQERETVLKMKAIKRKLEAEKKKRDGDKDSPEKVKEPQPYNAAPGPSTQQMVSPKKPLLSTPLLSTVILKPKLRVIKQEEPSRKISLISANEVDEPLISRTLSNNGRDQPVRRILTSKRELSAYSVEPSMSVSSVLRGAEGPSQNKQLSKKILKKGVVITKPADQAGLSMKIIDSASTLSSNIQMRLATSKAAAPGVTVAVDNISPSTTADSLKKLGLGLGLKKIIMKKAGSQQAAHLVFGSREGAEQFVANNQRKSLDLSVIDLKVI